MQRSTLYSHRTETCFYIRQQNRCWIQIFLDWDELQKGHVFVTSFSIFLESTM